MYKLYGAQRSGSAAVEIALQYCGVDYQLVNACSWEDGPGKAQLQRLNPLLQVPTLLLDDGTVLTESVAILIWLGLEFPDSGLLSSDSIERSRQLRGLVYIAANCYAAIGIVDYPERWLPEAGQERLKRLENGAKSRLHEYWDRFSDTFSAVGSWQPGSPGAAEILACVVTQWSGAREHLQHSRPDFHKSLLQIDRQPLVRSVIQRHWPAS